MKYSVSILFFTALIACSHKNQNEANEKHNVDGNYGQQLFESGFLDFADTLKFDSLKSELIGSFDIYNEANNRIAHIDAEELAEFNFDFFMPRLNKMLERRKFKLTVEKANDYEKTNDATVNGKRINLYTKEELESGTFWESATKNFFQEINKQLSHQNIAESFYLMYGGNDLHALLLTPDQRKIIAEKYKDEVKDIPYSPN